MDINEEYTQISVNSFSGAHKNYDALKGKVVDKVAFTNRNSYDCQMLIITFTDKTFISVGVAYNDREGYKDESILENNWVLAPQSINNGDYSVHSWTDSDGKLCFDEWINILRDLGIWIFNEDDAKVIMEQKAKEEEEREYRNYLRLKEKFEKKN